MENLKPLFGSIKQLQRPLIIAGPCSAESREQTLATALELAQAGIKFFRAGIWKPRTKPGSFEGVGARGLSWLVEVKKECGMTPLTEIASPAHLRSALRAGLSDFWIGARTTTNPFAMQEIADALADYSAEVRDSITILVKNPVNPDVELWIGALQRLYAAGIRRLGAIHRGFSSYGESLYRNRPVWSIPIELRRRLPNLPILCDPSHIAGRRDLIEKLSIQAIELNFDGIIIESHREPDVALSDASQQITPLRLKQIVDNLPPLGICTDGESLAPFREEIDRIDSELIALLARRMKVSKEIGEIKKRRNIPVIQPERYNALMARRVEEAQEISLSPDFMRRILSAIHEESVRVQIENDKSESNINNLD